MVFQEAQQKHLEVKIENERSDEGRSTAEYGNEVRGEE